MYSEWEQFLRTEHLHGLSSSAGPQLDSCLRCVTAEVSRETWTVGLSQLREDLLFRMEAPSPVQKALLCS
ncbi:hypothetical protein GN956_G3394 [Arapaima gigas]